MGKPVLTPEGNLLGKAFWLAGGSLLASQGQRGKGKSVQHSDARSWGLEAAKQLTTEGRRVVLPVESFLFSLTSLTPRISFQLEEGV